MPMIRTHRCCRQIDWNDKIIRRLSRMCLTQSRSLEKLQHILFSFNVIKMHECIYFKFEKEIREMEIVWFICILQFYCEFITQQRERWKILKITEKVFSSQSPTLKINSEIYFYEKPWRRFCNLQFYDLSIEFYDFHKKIPTVYHKQKYLKFCTSSQNILSASLLSIFWVFNYECQK